VAGGSSSNTTLYVDAAELYDPVTNLWSSAASMTTARSSHTATLLPSGKVLVAGGYTANGSAASAELWSACGAIDTILCAGFEP